MTSFGKEQQRRIDSNQRHANISKTYFKEAPTLPNLAKGVYHYLKSDPKFLGEDPSMKQGGTPINVSRGPIKLISYIANGLFDLVNL